MYIYLFISSRLSLTWFRDLQKNRPLNRPEQRQTHVFSCFCVCFYLDALVMFKMR